MTGTDLCVNKPHCTAAAQCGLFTHKSVPVIFEPPCTQARVSSTSSLRQIKQNQLYLDFCGRDFVSFLRPEERTTLLSSLIDGCVTLKRLVFSTTAGFSMTPFFLLLSEISVWWT